MTLPNLLTFSEVCELLKCSDKTLRAIIARGELRAAKVGATWRIREADLHAYLEAATYVAPVHVPRKPRGAPSGAPRERSWDYLVKGRK